MPESRGDEAVTFFRKEMREFCPSFSLAPHAVNSHNWIWIKQLSWFVNRNLLIFTDNLRVSNFINSRHLATSLNIIIIYFLKFEYILLRFVIMSIFQGTIPRDSGRKIILQILFFSLVS